jgi:hypothetical protein
MSFPKLLGILAIVLFSLIAISAMIKGGKNSSMHHDIVEFSPQEVELDSEIRAVAESPFTQSTPEQSVQNVASAFVPKSNISPMPTKPLPETDRVNEFFNKTEPKFPIVQTITYKSRVPWQKGRPAWLSDYASHFSTSRHFIARSLNGKPDYLKQDISEGGRFNVLNPDKNINFYLLIDTSRSKMWFYYLDLDTNKRVLVKTYQVGLGRIDSTKPSGLLTPLGKYSLGDKVAIYKPKMTGFHSGKKMELIRVFGTRWIPFHREIGESTASPEGFGIHGVPWITNEQGELSENIECLGKYESDGCIRLATRDMEELFAIIITRPTTIELVKDFYEADLPGEE